MISLKHLAPQAGCFHGELVSRTRPWLVPLLGTSRAWGVNPARLLERAPHLASGAWVPRPRGLLAPALAAAHFFRALVEGRSGGRGTETNGSPPKPM